MRANIMLRVFKFPPCHQGGVQVSSTAQSLQTARRARDAKINLCAAMCALSPSGECVVLPEYSRPVLVLNCLCEKSSHVCYQQCLCCTASVACVGMRCKCSRVLRACPVCPLLGWLQRHPGCFSTHACQLGGIQPVGVLCHP